MSSAELRERPASAAAYDVEAVRREFPILRQTIRDKPLVYLDNAASTQRPRAVIEAVSRFYREDNANVHRGVHTLSQRATDAYENARERVRRFLGAADPREVVFVRGTTEAINLAAQSWARPRLGPGDRVLVTWLEHHSNIVPWQLVCEQTGAELVVAPVDDRGALEVDALEAMLDERVKVVAIGHVSNALGTVNPVARVTRAAHAVGAKVVVDGAQAAPHVPIDVAALEVDFYAFSGHKVYGPMGIGALWGRAELLAEMPPWQGGGDMIRSVSFDGTTYADPPFRFEAGTPDVAGAVGLAAALDYVDELGLDAIEAHERRLLELATARVGAIPGVRLVGTAPEKAAVLSFVVEGLHPHDAGTLLDGDGVAVRAGHHCAQPLMERFGVPATIRASFGLYNREDEVEALARAVERAKEVFGV